MEEVYIKVENLDKLIAKYFKKKDLITIQDLIDKIEDLDYEVERLEEKIKELENYDDENLELIEMTYDIGRGN